MATGEENSMATVDEMDKMDLVDLVDLVDSPPRWGNWDQK